MKIHIENKHTAGFSVGASGPHEGHPGFPVLDLAPGHNEVDADHWEHVKNAPGVKAWLATGRLKEHKGEAPAPREQVRSSAPVSMPEGPAKLDANGQLEDLKVLRTGEALQAVDAQESASVLMSWMKSDTRKSVQDACAKKLETLGVKKG